MKEEVKVAEQEEEEVKVAEQEWEEEWRWEAGEQVQEQFREEEVGLGHQESEIFWFE